MVITKKAIVPQNQMNSKEYHGLRGYMNYSALRLYNQSRYRFYKEFIMGEIPEKEETQSTIIGSVCHVLLADQVNEFDAQFHIWTGTDPKGQLKELCDALYSRTLRSIVDGVQTEPFEALFKDAVTAVKYEYDGITEKAFKGKTVEKILELFTTADKEGVTAESYYKEKLECVGKTIVNMGQIQASEKIVEQLRTHPYTSDIVTRPSSEHLEVFNELVIIYRIGDVEYRSMVDKLWVDHINKTIQPYDYKITWDNEDGFEYSYLKNSYYLQVALYDTAVREFAKEHDLQEYKVLPMIYIVADSKGNNAPVLYKMRDMDVMLGNRGFSVRYKKYTGVYEIQGEIEWNLNTGDWTTSKEIAAKNGVLNMELRYK